MQHLDAVRNRLLGQKLTVFTTEYLLLYGKLNVLIIFVYSSNCIHGDEEIKSWSDISTHVSLSSLEQLIVSLLFLINSIYLK